VRATLALPFAVMEDGSMFMTVNIYKDDPEYEPGYRTQKEIKITINRKNT
jgi:hypothetical protein